MIEFGSGVSVIPIAAVKKKLNRSPPRFIKSTFSPREIEYCDQKRNRAEHYAARLAAKEACLRALGRSFDESALKKIEVVRKPSGQPTLKIASSLLRNSSWKGAQCDLSLAHERDAAIAFVLLSKSHGAKS